MSYEKQGAGFDPGAVGHERVGRVGIDPAAGPDLTGIRLCPLISPDAPLAVEVIEGAHAEVVRAFGLPLPETAWDELCSTGMTVVEFDGQGYIHHPRHTVRTDDEEETSR